MRVTRGKRSWLAGAVVALLALAVAAVGCGGGGERSGGGGGAAAEKAVSVVMVSHGAADDPFHNVVKNGANQAAKDFNVDFSYQAPEKGDVIEMGRLIRGAIARKPDGMAVSIADPDALKDPITQVVKAGVPLVAFNIGDAVFADFGAVAYYGQSETIAGRAAGDRFAELGVKNAVCVEHTPGLLYSTQRCGGFKEGVQAGGGKVTRLAAGTDPTDAQRKIEAALSKDESIDGLLALGPQGFTPSIAALESRNLLGKVKFATFDLSPEILDAVKDGRVEFAIDQQPYLQGYMSVQALAQNARLGVHPVGQIQTGPNLVTKEVADQVIELSGKGLR
jgi:simple sugar transport system substrate-binding protein